MKRKTKAPSQPSIEDERELEAVVDNDKEYVLVGGRRMGFHDLTPWALHKISRIMVADGGDDLSVGSKCLAAAMLNGYFKIKLFWWALWRYYFYIRQYTDIDLAAAVALVKKKALASLAVYSLNTTLLIETRETIMKMNRAEAKATLQELSTDKAGKSAKTGLG